MLIEIQEYILTNFKYFKSSDIVNSTNFKYNDICEVINLMEKKGLIIFNNDLGKYQIGSNIENNINLYNSNINKSKDFEYNKELIKNISKSISNKHNIDDIKGEFLFDIAKASDINESFRKIRNILISQGKNLKDISSQFITVYDTFEALDKDYIQRILVNLEAVKEADRKARKSMEEYKKIIETQKVVIEVLKKQKECLEQLVHLKDIDTFYKDFEDFKHQQEEENRRIIQSQLNITQILKKHEERLF